MNIEKSLLDSHWSAKNSKLLEIIGTKLLQARHHPASKHESVDNLNLKKPT